VTESNMDEKIGYLIAKVEEQGADLRKVSEGLTTLEKRVDEKFKTAEATFRVVKWAAGLTVAILTFKLGDIPKFWN
jgi:hypothetical protein